MPTSCERKTITRYSESDILKAVEDVRLGRLIVSKSAEKYNIPLSTPVNNIKEIRVRVYSLVQRNNKSHFMLSQQEKEEEKKSNIAPISDALVITDFI